MKPLEPESSASANSATSACWCEEWDLNPHGITIRPSNVRVCLFRHLRKTTLKYYTFCFQISQAILENCQKNFCKLLFDEIIVNYSESAGGFFFPFFVNMFCNSSVGHVDFDFKRRLVRFDYFKKHVVSAVGIFLIVACVFLFAFVVHPVQFDVVAYNLAQAGGNAHEEMCKTNSAFRRNRVHSFVSFAGERISN